VTNPTTINAPPGLPFVDVSREFDAPPAAVFRAHTDGDLFAQWTGPRSHPVQVVEWEAARGGRYKYVFHDGDTEYSFFGVFHSVEPDTALSQTFEFNMAPGHIGIALYTFESLDQSRSRLLVHEVYPSVESRDAALASGMEWGIKEGYERLDELL
jgi:uncharacterized protein YndB with AHSA1/START domain